MGTRTDFRMGLGIGSGASLGAETGNKVHTLVDRDQGKDMRGTATLLKWYQINEIYNCQT